MLTSSTKYVLYAAVMGVCLVFIPNSVNAVGSCGNDKACRIFVNITTVNPTGAELAAFKQRIQADGHLAATKWLMKNSKEFWTVQVKEFAEPYSDKDGNLGARLDETSATIIKVILDDLDFRRAYYDNFIATATGEVTGQNQDQLRLADGNVIPGYLRGAQSARHYEALEDLENFHQDGILELSSQSPTTFPSNQPGAPAGIFSTAGLGRAAYTAGTNRRIWPMITREMLCADIEDYRDVSTTEYYIHRDVIREDPDGSSTVFKGICKSCHGMMDQVVKAFMYYNFDNQAVVYTSFDSFETEAELAAHKAQHKLFNEASNTGYIAASDQFFVEWSEGQKNKIGLPKNAKSGFGAKALGKLLTDTGAFAKCQPQKAFRAVCGHMPKPNDTAFIKGLIRDFVSNGYKMQEMFAKSAIYCSGVTP